MKTHLRIHTFISKVVLVDPPIASLRAQRVILPILINLLQSCARGPLELGICRLDFGEAAIHQLFVVTPMVGHKTDDVLREIVHRYDDHEVAIKSQQYELITTAVAALGQNLLEIHVAGIRFSRPLNLPALAGL